MDPSEQGFGLGASSLSFVFAGEGGGGMGESFVLIGTGFARSLCYL